MCHELGDIKNRLESDTLDSVTKQFRETTQRQRIEIEKMHHDQNPQRHSKDS